MSIKRKLVRYLGRRLGCTFGDINQTYSLHSVQNPMDINEGLNSQAQYTG